jgi:tRNA-Thr(GGU) m(6)t(6)A37 methyltransferase TsaA
MPRTKKYRCVKCKPDDIYFKPIGIIHSPFKDVHGMPIQPAGAKGVEGTIEIEPEYIDGLRDIEGFSHIILIYYFHLSGAYCLLVKPFLDDTLRGVFSTRAPKRPNPIGLSIVRLVKVEGSILHIENVDIIDGTPLLDIKPYVPELDGIKAARTGWLSGKADKAHNAKADERFK